MNAAAVEIPAHVPHELVVDFDFMNPPGHRDDVHLAWKRAVENAPDIFWTPRNGGHWVAIRADDIEVMQRDHEHFSHESVTIPRPKSARLAPLEYDPPEHTPLRAILSPAFGPKPMQALQPDLRSLCIEPVHHAVDHRVLSLVLQREVDVAARRAFQGRHLAFDPVGTGCPFHRLTQATVELRNGNDGCPTHLAA